MSKFLCAVWGGLIFLRVAATVAKAIDEPLTVSGSTTMLPAVQAFVPILKEEFGIEMKINTQTGSTAAMQAVGVGTVDVAMVTRAVSQQDRSQFPEKRMFSVQIGWQVLAPVVSKAVWDSGIRTITKADMMAIYEGDIKSWKALGGEDQKIKFFNPEKGRGVWEVFVTWVYGDIRRAPLGKQWETIATNQEMRDAVEFSSSSISFVPLQWADQRGVFALSVKEEGDEIVAPTQENIRSGKWPLSRPLNLVSGDRPAGDIRKFFELIVSPRGQELVTKAEFAPNPAAEAELAERLR
jgi:phosphate transport system substrate-binding protein